MIVDRLGTSLARSATALLGALALGLSGAAFAWEGGSDALKPVPPLAARVTDLTATLSTGEREAIESKLAALENSTGAQVAVLIVATTQPEPIEAYAIRVADAWKIGRKGKDDGAVLVVAKDDRKLRLEVGYGLEGAIPDAIAKRIVSEDIAPKFREGRYAAGIDAGVERIVGIVARGAPPPPERKPASRASGFAGMDGIELAAILLLVVVPAVGGVLKSIFGKLGGATVGAAIAGGVAWFVLASVALAIGAAIVAWIVILVTGGGGGVSGARRGGGIVLPGGGWGGGRSGGGWSGGGGGFGGGGASGNW
ncbi:MAG: YgcG family protein [Burkholderiales bacterium]